MKKFAFAAALIAAPVLASLLGLLAGAPAARGTATSAPADCCKDCCKDSCKDCCKDQGRRHRRRAGEALCPCGGRCSCPEGACPDNCDTRCCPGGSCYLGDAPQALDPFPSPLPPAGKISLGGQVGPDGKSEVAIDLPVDVRIRNIGSHVDGLGMCVSTSMTHAARWHNLRAYWNFRDWCAKYPGGGYPGKMDKQVKQFAQDNHCECPAYVQYTGNDATIICQALQAGLCPSCTYDGRDGVRYSGHIDHMINVVYLDRGTNLAAVMDNNGKPEDLIWMSYDEFVERWTSKGRGGWCFLWLVPPPPPPPCN
jgi:hypothetical protein